MNVDLSFLSKDTQKKIKMIARFADKKGISAYIVGGIVRDLLLKRNSKDIDVVFEGDAISAARACSRELGAKVVVHQQFGTAALTCGDSSIIDFITARKETYRAPGALPRVQFSTLKDDLYRRDFTINSMAVQINEDGFGVLIDCFNGLKDLRAKKIRVHHRKSFIDDATRILRAVRFEQRFSFKIERNTLLLLKDALNKNKEKAVKAPRYFSEYRKFFYEPYPVKCLKRLRRVGGFRFLQVNNANVFRRLSDVEEGLRKYKVGSSPDSFYLMAFYEKETLQSIDAAAMKVSLHKGEKKSLIQSVHAQEILKELSKGELLKSQVHRILKLFNEDVVFYLLFRSKSLIVQGRINRFLTTDKFVTLNISGRDCRACGILPGEKTGAALKAVLDQKIDQGLKTKQDELKVLRFLASKEKGEKNEPYG